MSESSGYALAVSLWALVRSTIVVNTVVGTCSAALTRQTSVTTRRQFSPRPVGAVAGALLDPELARTVCTGSTRPR